jgi:hypothetical protein
MTRPRDLARLHRQQLVDWLLSAEVENVVWDGQDWLGLLQLFTVRLTSEAPLIENRDWMACSLAYDVAAERAVRTGGIGAHERAVRLINVIGAILERISPDFEVPLRNPRLAADTLVAALPIRGVEAAERAQRWRELPHADVLPIVRGAGLVGSSLWLIPHLDTDEAQGEALAEIVVWRDGVLPALRS